MAMSSSRVASILLGLSGLVWVVAGVLGWGGDVQSPLYLAGLVLFVLAFAALGYALVSHAPAWLRGVVTVATPALGYMVWVTILDPFGADYLPVLGAGVLLVVAGGIGLGRSSAEKRPPAARGRRASR